MIFLSLLGVEKALLGFYNMYPMFWTALAKTNLDARDTVTVSNDIKKTTKNILYLALLYS